MDHDDAPFFDELAAYGLGRPVPFSTPGHKRGHGASSALRDLLPDALALDIPHAGGVDTTHVSHGQLRRAERLAADAYGATDARFLVNGSTTGNLAMLLATCTEGDEVIVSRTLHRSLLAGLIFSGARPIYLTPAIDTDHNLPLDTDPGSVAATLAQHPAAKAVVLVSPSYVGVTSDLVTIARHCHAVNVPLLIDEAWGPHLQFHPALPQSAMQSGADVAVSSTHKMLGALTQGSTLVARTGRIDLERLHTSIDMVQTTSPSALIFASLDASRRQMALDGHRLLERTLTLALRLRQSLASTSGLTVIGPEIVAGRAGADFDPTRILVDVHELGITGYEAERILREEHEIFVEMSDLVSVMLLVTIGDSERSIQRATDAFTALSSQRGRTRQERTARSTGTVLFGAEQVLTPRQAFHARTVTIPAREAVGRISANSLTPYPPGIPVVTPGERLTGTIIDYLREGISHGMYVSGLADPTCETLRVVA